MSETRRETLKILGAIGATCAFPFPADELYGQHVPVQGGKPAAPRPGAYKPAFFEKQAFRVANVMEFPQKVWNECVRCPFFTNCKEVAVVLDLREGGDIGVPLVRGH